MVNIMNRYQGNGKIAGQENFSRQIYWGVGSLSSKRFRASSSRKLGREQKRGMRGEGREGNATQARVLVIWVFVISRFHFFIITLRLSLEPSSHYFEPPCKSYRGIGLLITRVRFWRSDFQDQAKLHNGDLESGASHIGQIVCVV